MIKKINCLLFIHLLLQATMMQASVQLIDGQHMRNLQHIKKQIENIQFEDILLDVFADATKTKTIQRRGILVRRSSALGTVVMCHGYLGCKRDSIALKHLFPMYNVLAFDFRAHGEDRQGQVSTIGRDEAFDVMSAAQFVKSDEQMRNQPIIAYGFSMGAVSAIQAQSLDDTLFDAMILDCPYDSTDDAMGRGLSEKMQMTLFGKKITIPGKQFLLNHMYDESAQTITNIMFQAITKLDSNKVATKFVKVTPVESVKNITVPCYFIHCVHDKKVPVQAVMSLYENKPGFKRLWLTDGKGHFGSYQNNPELYWYKINKFVTKLHQQDIATRLQERIYDELNPVKILNNRNNRIVTLDFGQEPVEHTMALQLLR